MKGQHAVTGSIDGIDVLPGLVLLVGGLATVVIGTIGWWLIGASSERVGKDR